jgi:hypothetical protein
MYKNSDWMRRDYTPICQNLLQCDGRGACDVVSDNKVDKRDQEQNIPDSDIPGHEEKLTDEPRNPDTQLPHENPPFHPSGQFLRGRFDGANPSKLHEVFSKIIQ